MREVQFALPHADTVEANEAEMGAPMRRKVLIVEAEGSAGAAAPALEKAGHEIRSAGDGLAGLQQFYSWRPDLVILDIAIPRMDGWTLCRRLREVSDVPILMLTTRAGESLEVKALQDGADGYMTKPFHLPLLLARVEALLRRSHQVSSPPDRRVIKVGQIKIDLPRYEATLANKPLHLTPTEFRLLVALASRAGEVVPHDELLEQVWGHDCDPDDLYLKLYICYLRRKIEADPRQPRYIRTERRVGYCLCNGSDPNPTSTAPFRSGVSRSSSGPAANSGGATPDEGDGEGVAGGDSHGRRLGPERLQPPGPEGGRGMLSTTPAIPMVAGGPNRVNSHA